MSLRNVLAPGLAAAAAFAAAACCHHARDWNSAARLTQAYALAQMGRLDSTPLFAPAAEELGPAAAARFPALALLPRDPPTRDGAFVGGRFWSDKAPGQALLAAFAGRLVLWWGAPKHPVPTRAQPLDPATLSRLPTDYWLTLGSSGLCAACLAALFCRAALAFGATPASAVAAALACGFATPLLPYATLCYGHLAAGWWLALAAWLLHGGTPSPMRAAAAGLAAGAAVATEYTLLPVAGWFALTAWRSGGVRQAWAFVMGGLPMAAGLAYYHYLVTGDPLVPAYRYEFHAEFAALHGRNAGVALGMPRWDALRELLVGSRRGLLLHAWPVWAAAPGLWWLRRRNPGLARACAGGFGLLLLTVAAFPKWDGGLAAGPRFLVPGLPLLLLPAALWATAGAGSWLRRLWWVSAALGGAALATLNAAGASVPPGIAPWEYIQANLVVGAETHAGHWLLGAETTPAAALAVFLGLHAGIAVLALGGAMLLGLAETRRVR